MKGRHDERPRSRFRALWPLTLAAALLPGAVASDEPLVGDRPDFTESAVTVGAGRIQLEAGATATRAGDVDTLSAGEVLLRVGLGERWEFRLGANSYTWIDSPGGDVSGREDPSIGAKLSLLRPEDGGTTLAVLFGTTLDAGSDALGAGTAQPELRALAAWPLTDRLEIASNAGYGRPHDGSERFDQFLASVSLALSVSDSAGVFFELYGFNRESSTGSESTYFDAGFTHALGESLQIDLRAGTGLAGNEIDGFFGLGLVKRW